MYQNNPKKTSKMQFSSGQTAKQILSKYKTYSLKTEHIHKKRTTTMNQLDP